MQHHVGIHLDPSGVAGRDHRGELRLGAEPRVQVVGDRLVGLPPRVAVGGQHHGFLRRRDLHRAVPVGAEHVRALRGDRGPRPVKHLHDDIGVRRGRAHVGAGRGRAHARFGRGRVHVGAVRRRHVGTACRHLVRAARRGGRRGGAEHGKAKGQAERQEQAGWPAAPPAAVPPGAALLGSVPTGPARLRCPARDCAPGNCAPGDCAPRGLTVKSGTKRIAGVTFRACPARSQRPGIGRRGISDLAAKCRIPLLPVAPRQAISGRTAIPAQNGVSRRQHRVVNGCNGIGAAIKASFMNYF